MSSVPRVVLILTILPHVPTFKVPLNATNMNPSTISIIIQPLIPIIPTATFSSSSTRCRPPIARTAHRTPGIPFSPQVDWSGVGILRDTPRARRVHTDTKPPRSIHSRSITTSTKELTKALRPRRPRSHLQSPLAHHQQCTKSKSPLNLNSTDSVNGLPDATVEFNPITFDSNGKIISITTPLPTTGYDQIRCSGVPSSMRWAMPY